MKAGSYITKGRIVRWDGRNEFEERVANGAYIYQLQAGDKVFVKRMVVRTPLLRKEAEVKDGEMRLKGAMYCALTASNWKLTAVLLHFVQEGKS